MLPAQGNTVPKVLPDLKRSLLSIDMLAKDGYKTTLSESVWMTNQGNLKIGGGHKYNNLYPLLPAGKESKIRSEGIN